MKDKKTNIIKYRNFHINIGMVIFTFIIIYVLFSVFTYFTTDTVSEYEVTQGTITTNHIYKGLAIRKESVVAATESGNINYFRYDSSKAGVNDIICSIDNNGAIKNKIELTENDSNVLNTISTDVDSILKTYDFNYFQNIQSMKMELSSKIQQSKNQNALGLSKDTDIVNIPGVFFIKPSYPGIVSYYVDGMENLTKDNFSPEDFDKISSYKKINLSDQKSINTGDQMYRIVTDENWNLIIEVPSDIAKQFEEKNVLKIKFCKDNYETYANFTIDCKENIYYLVFSLNKAMIRYINDRYLDIELVISEKSGLKIPNSSIVEKNFYTIPTSCFMKGGDSNEEGVLVQRKDKDDNTYTEFIIPTIYYKTDDLCYIDNEFVTNNDVLIKENGQGTYTVGDDVDSLLGVYNINKGYAVFKQIKILSKNEDYSIVETKTSYGIALYDHIALEGNKVKENQTIKK